MTDDAALLRRYATDRAEEAFDEFVRRNLPLVFSAASRRLGGDAHRAADVAQVVFCAAARDARRLSEHARVTGWLYVATRNAAHDLIRGEIRRRNREQEVHLMQQDLSESEVPADWSRLRPVLDSAMDELNATDREAVLLRFFQDRPFAEVGAALGLSADSARKRVERAVEKLGSLLRRRGVASTSAALATLLAAENAVALPPALAASITGAAVAGGGAVAGATVFLGVSKLQAAAAALVVAGGVAGLVSQQHTISSLRDELASREQRLVPLAATHARLAQTEGRAAADSTAPRPGAATLRAPAAKPSPVSAPETPLRAATIAPTAKQLADMHRRYDPMFRELGFTAEQQGKFIDVKLRQFEVNDDFQAAVRQSGLNGSSPGVEKLRAQISAPLAREFHELMGDEGMAVYTRYEVTSGRRLAIIEPIDRLLTREAAPLTDLQTEKMLAALAANTRGVQVKPTDISKLNQVDWGGLMAQAEGFLTPAQFTALQNYLASQKKREPSR